MRRCSRRRRGLHAGSAPAEVFSACNAASKPSAAAAAVAVTVAVERPPAAEIDATVRVERGRDGGATADLGGSSLSGAARHCADDPEACGRRIRRRPQPPQCGALVAAGIHATTATAATDTPVLEARGVGAAVAIVASLGHAGGNCTSSDRRQRGAFGCSLCLEFTRRGAFGCSLRGYTRALALWLLPCLQLRGAHAAAARASDSASHGRRKS